MSFFEDLKNNRDKQIMAISIVFFVLAFPLYFGLAAAGADGSAGLNEVKMYEVTGETTLIEIAAGDEFIANGDPLIIDDLHTDSIDWTDPEDLNIIGVVLSMSYTESEESSSLDPFGGGCNGITGGNVQPDTITGTTMHGEFNATASGSNNGESGTHTVESYWINNMSIVTHVVVDPKQPLRVVMSKAEIISMIDADGAGLGAYSAEISVDAQSSSTATCDRSDEGEQVSYVIELVVFDYDIRPWFDVDDL